MCPSLHAPANHASATRTHTRTPVHTRITVPTHTHTHATDACAPAVRPVDRVLNIIYYTRTYTHTHTHVYYINTIIIPLLYDIIVCSNKHTRARIDNRLINNRRPAVRGNYIIHIIYYSYWRDRFVLSHPRTFICL